MKNKCVFANFLILFFLLGNFSKSILLRSQAKLTCYSSQDAILSLMILAKSQVNNEREKNLNLLNHKNSSEAYNNEFANLLKITKPINIKKIIDEHEKERKIIMEKRNHTIIKKVNKTKSAIVTHKPHKLHPSKITNSSKYIKSSNISSNQTKHKTNVSSTNHHKNKTALGPKFEAKTSVGTNQTKVNSTQRNVTTNQTKLLHNNSTMHSNHKH